MRKQTKKVRLTPRARRKVGIRKKLTGTNERPRICVFRSAKHTYAQIITDDEAKVLATVSTQDKSIQSRADALVKEKEELKERSASTKSMASAWAVGEALAKKASENNVTTVVFDRNGFLYHGRIKAIADGARSGGLQF